MKLPFLFWNLRGAQEQTRARRDPALLRSIGRFGTRPVDVLLFAECRIDAEAVLRALNGGPSGPYYSVASESRRVRFFSRLPGAAWADRFLDRTGDRITAQEVQVGPLPGFLLIGAHLDAANYQSLADRAEWARDIAADIRTLEGDLGHSRTVFVGDLNMNPFDGGLVETSALHAVMTRELARKAPTWKARKGASCFYNPMWSFFGDWLRSQAEGGSPGKGPAGSYYFSNTRGRANWFWNVYDQVLLRPSLMDRLSWLEICDHDGEESLVGKDGRPREGTHTDHLPIYFEMTF